MKSLLCFLIFVSVLGALPSFAENYAAPILSPVTDTYLEVQNVSAEARPFWFQDIGSNPFTEKYHEVPAKRTLQLPLADDYTKTSTAFAVKALHADLKFQVLCKSKSLTWALQDQSSAWKKITLGSGSEKLTLHLVNLAQAENPVEIQSGDYRFTKTVILPKELASTSISLDLPAGTDSLLIRGTGRLSAIALSASNHILPLTDEVQALVNVPYRRYFLFQSIYNQESFVAGLDDAKLIQESKDQIADPTKARILIARIEKSIGGGNRDLQNITKNSWSWRVTEGVTYTDFAHISCDGSPSVVEERLDDWMKNTGSSICFWGYRVQREVSFVELMQSPLWLRPGPRSLLHKR